MGRYEQVWTSKYDSVGVGISRHELVGISMNR